jgi:hypothetical protein
VPLQKSGRALGLAFRRLDLRGVALFGEKSPA